MNLNGGRIARQEKNLRIYHLMQTKYTERSGKDVAWHGTLTTEHAEEFMWWGHEKAKILGEGKIRGLNTVTGFTNSQNLAWMNSLIIIVDLAASVLSEEFCASAYEWTYNG